VICLDKHKRAAYGTSPLCRSGLFSHLCYFHALYSFDSCAVYLIEKHEKSRGRYQDVRIVRYKYNTELLVIKYYYSVKYANLIVLYQLFSFAHHSMFPLAQRKGEEKKNGNGANLGFEEKLCYFHPIISSASCAIFMVFIAGLIDRRNASSHRICNGSQANNR
jgi:hypothetical protein